VKTLRHNNRKYYLRKRLQITENFIENYISIERDDEISKKAIKAINKENPILGFIYGIWLLPIKIICFFRDKIWQNRYRKTCKEVEIIKKELESCE